MFQLWCECGVGLDHLRTLLIEKYTNKKYKNLL